MLCCNAGRCYCSPRMSPVASLKGIGFTGLLLFVLRVPNDEPDPRWRGLERALPLIALVLTLLLLASYGSAFGYRTETGTRAGILIGFVIASCALTILMLRRRTQTPEDYQRVRWVILGLHNWPSLVSRC